MQPPEVSQAPASQAAGRFVVEQAQRARRVGLPLGRAAQPAARSGSASWAWAVAALLAGLLIGAVVFAPARWLAAAVGWASGERVLVQDASGSFWQGSARLVLSAGAGARDAQMLPGRVQWRLRPDWRGAHLTLGADCCTTEPLHAAIALGWGRTDVALSGPTSRWPAALLSGLGTPMNTLAPTGSLALTFQGLQLQWVQGQWRMDGAATLDVLELSSRLSTLKPLGSYRMQFQGGDVLAVALSTTSGALQLSGVGQWVGGRLRFRGEAQAGAEHEAALANLINIMTRREGGKAVINIG
jgi:general secretion pathway protein N